MVLKSPQDSTSSLAFSAFCFSTHCKGFAVFSTSFPDPVGGGVFQDACIKSEKNTKQKG